MRDVSDCTDFRFFFRAFVLLGDALDGDELLHFNFHSFNDLKAFYRYTQKSIWQVYLCVL